MKKDIQATIFPIRPEYFDNKYENLYKLIDEFKVKNNELLSNTSKIILYISENDVLYSESTKKCLERLFSEVLNVSIYQINAILRFIFEANLIEIIDNKLILTNFGKLFMVSDSTSAYLDMLRYYWESMDWSKAYPLNESNRFLEDTSKRYAACLLHQLDDVSVSEGNEKLEKYQLDVSYFNFYNTLTELMASKTINLIFKHIFEPLDLMKVDCDGSNLTITELGKVIFKYYSYNMIDEYSELLDDCWECYDRGNFEQAHEIARNIMAVIPTMTETYNIIGCVHIKLKEYEKAMQVFKYAIDTCNKSLDNNKNRFNMDDYISLYFNLGLCYFYMGQLINALHIFADIKKTVPYNLENVNSIIDNIKEIIIIRNNN